MPLKQIKEKKYTGDPETNSNFLKLKNIRGCFHLN